MDARSPARMKLLAFGSVGIALLAAAIPMLWGAAVLAVALASILVYGRWRWFVLGVGGVLAVASLARFALEVAKPNLQFADQDAAEKNAVSRIREIYWAESQARQFKLVDANNDGTGEYLSFAELVGDRPERLHGRAPLLKPGLYTVVDAARGIYRSEAYLYVLFLPGKDGSPTALGTEADPASSSRAFAAYAWPLEKDHGRRTYYVDQYEQICESDNEEGFIGPDRTPEPAAYALNASEGVSKCGRDDDYGPWHAWKPRKDKDAKEPRAVR